MIITYSNWMTGKKVDFREVTTDGPFVPSPGPLAPSKRPRQSGAVMGAAPDSRGLPEWIEFRWQEWPYPGVPYPSDFAARQVWNQRVDDLVHTLPIKSARVTVRQRVPADVVEQVLKSKNGSTAVERDLALWVFFAWHEDGVRFHWELRQGCCDVKREGGDVID